jgi:DNA-binding CsgD family transcriptional regulator
MGGAHPPKARTAALVAAAALSGRAAPIAAALERLGADASALTAAERAGLLTVANGRIRVDPKATLSYETAAPEERQAVHRALALVLADDPDLQLWHTAAATELPDERIARDLEAAAARSDRIRASRLLERAGHLSIGEQDRAARLLAAGRAAHAAGLNERAVALLDDALAGAPGPVLRARIQHERGRLRLHGDTEGLHQFLVAEAGSIATTEPGLAARMLADAAIAAATNDMPLAMSTIERAVTLSRGIPEVEPLVELARASILARAGTATDAEPVLQRVLSSSQHDHGELFEAMNLLATVPLWREDYRAARRVLVALVESARTVGTRSILPVAMDTLALIDFRTGHWPRAHRTSAAALRIARELGQTWQSASCLTTLAGVEAGRGAAVACRRHLAEALELGPEDVLLGAYALRAEALLHLGLAAHEEAARILDQLERLLSRGGFASPDVVACLPDLVEALARAGRLDDAAAAYTRLEAQIRLGAPPTIVAAAARCAGLLAGREAYVAHFETALHAHEQAETPFERARTELCYGERLRRERQRSSARPHLERAAATFERLGAQPWARRARRELGHDATAGGRDAPALTAHERQVVSLVVEGATNAEAARQLYVSPKTIEHHLGHVYRKLGLRSRTQLVRRWLEADGRL